MQVWFKTSKFHISCVLLYEDLNHSRNHEFYIYISPIARKFDIRFDNTTGQAIVKLKPMW